METSETIETIDESGRHTATQPQGADTAAVSGAAGTGCPADSSRAVAAPAEAPAHLSMLELMRTPGVTDPEDVPDDSARVLASRRPSVWDID